MCADGQREIRIISGLLGDHALGREGELAAVAVGVPEEGRQALAQAGDLGILVEMFVHARDVRLQLRDQVWRA
jgi:hypothetical protein